MHVFNPLSGSHCLLCLGSCGGAVSFCTGCVDDMPWADRFLASSDWPVFASFFYQFPLNSLISSAKFRKNPGVCNALSSLMWSRAPELDWERWSLCPVPLSWRRHAGRGFNQSAELAKGIAHASGAKLAPGLLRRIRHGIPQRKLGRSDRLQNAVNAFRGTTDVSGKRVVLVDDVYTTGATLRAAREALLDAGASAVVAWVCAAVR